MTVKQLSCGERFSNFAIGKQHERFFATQLPADDPHIYKPVVYKCGNCDHEIEFKEQSFKKHSHSEFTNLLIRHKSLIDEFIRSNNIHVDSFLDFYCPGCKRAVSVFYKDGYGGRHGEYLPAIEFVLEIH